MAESSEISAGKVFNYICGSGGIAELSHLLKHPSPLAKKTTEIEVILWFKTQKELDPENKLVLIKNQHGGSIGMRIDLKKHMCLKYTTESCKSSKRCKFWHICKEFIEGTCKGNCGRSHDFHDEDNKEKTLELGFEKKPSGSLKGIVAGSFMQVCLKYLKNECVSSSYCPYLHICSSAVRVTPCECVLSHNFADPHNKNILEQYGFRPPRKSEVEVVRCNTLIPKHQKPFEANFTLSEQATPGGLLGRFPLKGQGYSKGIKCEPVRLAALVQEAGITEARKAAPPTSHQNTAAIKADPLPEKVFNFICGKGGVASLSELLRHPSPLARKFSGPEQEYDARIWLQVQAQSGQRIILLEDQDGEIVGARVYAKKKMCLHYFSSKGFCKSNDSCMFWHICKGYLEDKCQGQCGLSHDLHDKANMKKVEKMGVEKHPSSLRKIVANSFPQVCLMYLKNECQSSYCPYLHICSHLVQGVPCLCSLSHNLADEHNRGIMTQYDLAPEKTKPNIMQCNILIPKQQKSFEEAQTNSSSSQGKLNMILTQQNENILGSQSQGSRKSTEKKKRRKPRQRKKKANQPGETTGESQCSNADDVEEESSDSVSDNEDVQDKPDLYASPKFALDPSPHSSAPWQDDRATGKVNAATSKKPPKGHQVPSNYGLMKYEQVSSMVMNEAAEGNLISLSDEDDDWQGVDASQPVDDFWAFEPLSQVDELFFSNSFSSGVAGSLSQDSTFSNSSDQISSESHLEKAAVNEVFQYICNEHNGLMPYTEISQCKDLLPPDVIDITAWFKENNNRFITIESKTGEIEAVRAYSPKARICFQFLMTKQGCKNPKCFRYHVCRHYLAIGACPLGNRCRLSHSHNLQSSHNKRITKRLNLGKFSEEQLRVLISASVPEVCLDYNSRSGRCNRGLKCNGIHICKYFVVGSCKKGDDCPLGHQSSLERPHTKLVLEKYNLTKVPLRAVFSALLIRQMPASVKVVQKPNTGKAKQIRDVPCSPQYICLDFLLGHCSKEQLCDHYHYSTPYMWQYKLEDPSSDQQGDIWKSFTQSENEAIEQQFCDINVVVADMEHIMIEPPPSVLIDPGEGHIKVNFDDMNAKTGFGQVQLRRLSTKPAVSPTDHALSTQWVWYWLDENNSSWRRYDSELMLFLQHQMELHSSRSRAPPFFKFKIGGEDQKMFFRKVPIYQQSTRPPLSITRVRRRPVFRSVSGVQRLQRPLELPVPLEPETPQSPVTSAPGRLPSQWTSVPDDNEEFIRVSLPPSSDQFKLAESLFRRSMSENKASIVSIERVQNPFVWEKYARKKEQMEKRARIKDSPVNEKLLFHGTDPQDIDGICAENIDWRALDENRAAQFGQGAYFTEEAALSKLYCKQDSESLQYMILAEVLVGSFAKGEPSMKRPPVKDESASKKELYDSCVDNVEKPSIFVLFDADQYYPTFLIKFKTKSKVVC